MRTEIEIGCEDGIAAGDLGFPMDPGFSSPSLDRAGPLCFPPRHHAATRAQDAPRAPVETRHARSMNEETWSAVDEYLAGLLVQRDAALEAALKSSAAAELPEIQVSECQGKFLQLLARVSGARKILELGTLGGFSTLWLAGALPAGGSLITVESEERHAAVARENLARAGFAESVEVRVGPALDILPRIAAEAAGPFDLIFIGADKANYPEYLAWALRLSRRGTVIVADNIVRNGAVLDASSDDANVRGVRRFCELLAAEPRVTATGIQTVGAKGYDGFAFALVTADE